MKAWKWFLNVSAVFVLLLSLSFSMQGCGEFKCEKDDECSSNATYSDKGLNYCSRGACVACTKNEQCKDGKICSADSQTCVEDTKKEEKPKELTEPSTGIKFLSSIKVHDSDKEHFLLGMGPRIKVIIKVYALGVYVEPKGAAFALKSFKGKKPAELKEDKDFYKTLLEGNFGKSVRLVMAIDLDNETMTSAFDDSLEPRLKTEDGKKALQEFKKFFDKLLKEGEDIVFTFGTNGELHTSINGKFKGTIKNKDLAQALLASYLDDNPSSPQAKENLASGLDLLFQKADQ